MNRERPFISQLVNDVPLPKMFKVKQQFPRPQIEVDEIPKMIENLLSAGVSRVLCKLI